MPNTGAKYFEGSEICLREIILNFDINFQFYHCNSIHIRTYRKRTLTAKAILLNKIRILCTCVYTWVSVIIILCLCTKRFACMGRQICILKNRNMVCWIDYFICLFIVPLRIFHSYWDVTIGGDGLQIDLCLALMAFSSMAFSSEGSFACHTCCNTGPQFLRSYTKDPWFSFLNTELLAKSNHYLL